MPDFDFESVETVQDSTSGVDLYFRIPSSSLVFVRDGSSFRARYELRVRIIPDNDKKSPIETSWFDTLRAPTSNVKEEVSERIVIRRASVPPGEYLIETSLEDAQSAVVAWRRQRVHVLDPREDCAILLRPRLEYRVGGRFSPFLPLHIPRTVDSLRALVNIRHPDRVLGRQITVFLYRYNTDSVPAAPPFYLTASPWALRRMGVDFRSADTIWNSSYSLGTGSEVQVPVPLENLRWGMHELVVRCSTVVCPSLEEPEELVARRYLVVVDRDFPRVTRIGQLTETLLYLATEKEYHELILPESDEKTKEKFEKFWLRLGDTPQAAANLIKQYHARVEEANLLFSDYKEGWKTDKGMVYVIFGSPPLIERQYRTERWTYSSGALFIFERLIEQRSDLPFENWELIRDASYEWYWEKERDRWRRGQIF